MGWCIEAAAAARESHQRRRLARAHATSSPPSKKGTGLSPELKASIDELVSAHKVVAFIKGTKQFPQCGFSNTVVQILRQLDAPFEAVNILESEVLRSGMKEYSAWPTFPQVYVDGEFFGGCDIMLEAFQSGELSETLERVLNE